MATKHTSIDHSECYSVEVYCAAHVYSSCLFRAASVCGAIRRPNSGYRLLNNNPPNMPIPAEFLALNGLCIKWIRSGGTLTISCCGYTASAEAQI